MSHPEVSPDVIRLKGVRVHNLQGIDVEIPRNKLTVVTGVSGSGKSSLAFDTLYAEGRRRFVECLSTYLQQFLERIARPDLDSVSHLPPAIALERAVPAAQARSTVGSTTEVHDYLRLLFARIGRTYCIDCGRSVKEEPVGSVARVLLREGGKAFIAFEVRAPKNRRLWPAFRRELERDGFVRLCRGDETIPVDEAEWEAGIVQVVVDRLVFEKSKRARIVESLETAYRFGGGRAVVRWSDGRLRRFSRQLHCPDCDREYRRPQPQLFSPNSPLGACPVCQGFGRSIQPDLERIVPDAGLTLKEGPVDPWNKPSHRAVYDDLRRAGRKVGLRWSVPYRDLPEAHRRLIEEGGEGFYGIQGFFKRLERKIYKLHVRVFLSRYRTYLTCAECEGRRLSPEARAVRVGRRTMTDLDTTPLGELLDWVLGLRLSRQEREIARPIFRELERRVGFLVEVGLGYLTLQRPSRTLSGGEHQRIQLARALGSALVDTLFVLDEPSVGLHPSDVERLIDVVVRLRDAGNTVVVVEHDPRVMRRADWIIDLGPGAGAEGGRLLYQGAVEGFLRSEESLTAAHLAGRHSVAPDARVSAAEMDAWIELSGARTHNLQDLTVRIPRRALTVVTGVSGSGKSSLIHDTLFGAVTRALGGAKVETGPYRELRGVEGLTGVERIDQSPLGRSPRSNAATYVKAFAGIRKRLAATPAARARGLKAGYFSFNVPGGRCDACEGAGSVIVEMHFMPDLLVPCEACGGSRYGAGALEVRDRGRNVTQILALTVREALEVYRDVPEIARRLGVLEEIGLGYLRLGQPLTTVSGGEAQRLKLASHLGTRGTRSRLFLLDEPTTGLHLNDVAVLLRLLGRLVAEGHTVVVVEHHLDLIRAADWVIDLGPGPGDDGGRIVAEGPPDVVARSAGETGRYLARSLRSS